MEIPRGVKKIAQAIGESPEKFWPALQGVITTEEKALLFNETVEAAYKEAKRRGKSDFDAARHAMSRAGDVLLGENRPSSPADAVIRSAGPLMRPVRQV